jgi:subtilase family serine protease
MLVSSLAMTAHSADVRKIKPGDLRQAPNDVQTPEKIDTGHIQRPKADLTITAMPLYPANPKKGGTVRFTAKVINMRLAGSAASQGGIRVGGESSPQLFPVPALAPNAVHTITRYQHMAQLGNCRVAFIADANGDMAESNENNNEKSTDFSVKEHNEHNNAIKMSITVGP